MKKNKNNKSLDKFLDKLNKTVLSLTTPSHMKQVGERVKNDIKIRTRLGYGVRKHGDQKSKLKPLSQKYVEQRKKFHGLSTMTTARRSNLTYHGSMLDSLRLKAISRNSISIGPSGYDVDNVSNVAKTNFQEKAGRIYLRMSAQEIKKARIFWLRRFSSLLKSKKIN